MFQKLEESIGFHLNITALALKCEFEKRLAPLDITAVQFSVLKTLEEENGLSQKEIAARTYKTGAEITRVLDRLEAKKFVTRNQSEHDRREFCIRLTDEGYQIVSEALSIGRELIKKATREIDEDELKAALATVKKIFSNISGV